MPISTRSITPEAGSPADSTPATAFSSWLGQDIDSGVPASFEDRIDQIIPITNKQELSTILDRGTIDNIDVVGAYDIIKDLSDDKVNELLDVQSMEALQLLVGAPNDGLFGPNTRLALKNASDSITAVMEELKKKEPSEVKPVNMSEQTLEMSLNAFDMNIEQPDSITNMALESLASLDANAGRRDIDLAIHESIGASDYEDASRIAYNYLNSVSRQETEDNVITQKWIDNLYNDLKGLVSNDKNLRVALKKHKEKADILRDSFGLNDKGVKRIFKNIGSNTFREKDLGFWGKDNPPSDVMYQRFLVPQILHDPLDLIYGSPTGTPML